MNPYHNSIPLDQFLFFIASTLAFLGITWFLMKKLGIKYDDIFYKPVKKTQIFVEIPILIAGLVYLYFALFEYPEQLPAHYFWYSFVALSLFRGFIEWKFRMHTKEYVITFFSAFYLMFFLISIDLWFYKPPGFLP